MPAENRGRVLRAAAESFMRHGYQASVDEIARRAGVAKQTVYHHFASKDALFKAVAHELTRGVLVELESGDGDVRAGLNRFALAYRSRALGAQGLATFRTVLPEVPRFRALARAMYDAGAGQMVREIAAYLERAMRAGDLRRDDPQFAAELLLGMLAGHDRVKRLFGVERANGADEARSRQIVDCFLRAYQP
ncbi:MAG TPA: TetR/AcrR family transcriptional regulator [Burkholderiales bacterium]|nr:TetR/AcrR family transcriptional regulator [Burkholderiales bacterium]